MKNFLFVIRHSPYAGTAIRENLDMLMTVAAFDQPVRVLFLDDGVFALKAGQQPEVLGLRPVAPLLAALDIYGIEGLWVEDESLAQRGLCAAGLVLPTISICRAEVAGFVAEADIVVSG
jgi:tRNA 2-thiouridine synthesizing protein C